MNLSSTQIVLWGRPATKLCQRNATSLLSINEPYPTKRRKKTITAFNNKGDISSIFSVAAGYFQSTFLTKNGSCYSWNDPTCDQSNTANLQNTYNSEIHRIEASNMNSSNLPQKILVPHMLEKVKHGFDHSIGLGLGQVWGWGSPCNGKLGIYSTKEQIIKQPIAIYFRKSKISCIDIDCGNQYTIAVMENGEVFCFGIHPGMEIREKMQYHRPIKVSMSVTVERVACGTKHSVLMTLKGRQIYSWGCGKEGRLGHGDELDRCRPEQIFAFEGKTAKQFACGEAHTLILLEGFIVGFGCNSHGQIGIGKQTRKILLPTKSLEGKTISDISCGYAHSVACTKEGDVYTWGCNEVGQLGHNHERNVLTPMQVKNLESAEYRYVTSIECGHSHTLCIVSDTKPEDKINNKKNEKELLKEHNIKHAGLILGRFSRYVLFKLQCKKQTQIKKVSKQNDAIPEVIENEICEEQSKANARLILGRFIHHILYKFQCKKENQSMQERREDEEKRRLCDEQYSMQIEDQYAIKSQIYWRQMDRRILQSKQMKNELLSMLAEDKASKIYFNEVLKIETAKKELEMKRKKQLEEQKKREIRLRTEKERQLKQLQKVKEQMKKQVDRLNHARQLKARHKNQSLSFPSISKRKKKIKENNIGKENHNLNRLQKYELKNNKRGTQDNIKKSSSSHPSIGIWSKRNKEVNERLLKKREQRMIAEQRRIMEDKKRKEEAMQKICKRQEMQNLKSMIEKNIETLKNDQYCNLMRDRFNFELETLYNDLNLNETPTFANFEETKPVKFMSFQDWADNLC